MDKGHSLGIKVDNVCHHYAEGVPALSNINFEAGAGLHGLLGENGAGKSTLMRIICTVMPPSVGCVSVCGFDVVSERNDVRRLLGYLPQEFGAWRRQTVSEVLDTLASLSGLTARQQRLARVQEVLMMVGLQKVSKRRVGHLSGGMLRRLGVAQALVHDPRVLVMDEPTIGLDPEERLKFRQLITELGRERVILLSTHIVADLGASCEQIFMLSGGQLSFAGNPQELVDKARGKVWQIEAEPSENIEAVLPDSFELVARQTRDGRAILRGVSHDGRVPERAQAAENITLEEAYLSFTAVGAKHEAVH